MSLQFPTKYGFLLLIILTTLAAVGCGPSDTKPDSPGIPSGPPTSADGGELTRYHGRVSHRVGGLAFSRISPELLVIENGEGIWAYRISDSAASAAVHHLSVPGIIGEIVGLHSGDFAICGDSNLLLTSPDLGATTRLPVANGQPVSLCLSTDENTLACGTSLGWVCAFDMSTRTQTWAQRVSNHPLPRDPKAVSGVAFIDGNSMLVAVSHDGTVTMLDSRNGAVQRRIELSERQLTAVSQLGDGTSFMVCGIDGLFRFQSVGRFLGHERQTEVRAGVISLTSTLDRTLLASGGLDRHVRLWNSVRESQISLVEMPDVPTALAFNELGTQIAIGTESGEILVRDVAGHR